jgi:ribosome-binding factor A
MSSEHYYRTPPSKRQLQVGAAIQRLITKELFMNEFLHSNFNMISITGVRMNGGLKNATIIFMTTSDCKSTVKSILQDLQKSAGYFRKIIGSSMKLRSIPEISFEYDKIAGELEILHENLRKYQSHDA